MARNRRNASAVSLFPFLAVLMCTMGALIVLLVVISQQIRDDTLAKAREARQEQVAQAQTAGSAKPDEVPEKPTVPEDEPLLPELAESEDPLEPLLPLPELDAIRQDVARFQNDEVSLREELERRKSKIASVKRQTSDLDQKNRQIVARNEELSALVERAAAGRDRAEERRGSVEETQRRLARLVTDSKRLLDDEKKHQEAGSPFVIVPFDGASGTTRRPILLECTDRSIRFVAEDIDLTPSQLMPFTPRDNPLLAGARELVQFWSAWNSVREDPAQERKPYVLLIVRPSGTVAYYVARKMLSELGADFGYELVDKDFDYAVPETEERATELCRAAVRDALQRKSVSPRGPATFADGLDAELRRGANSGRGSDARNSGTGRSGDTESFSAAEDSGHSFNRINVRALRHYGGTPSQKFFSSDSFRDRRRATPGAGTGDVRAGREPSGRQGSASTAGPPGFRAPILTPSAQLKSSGARSTPSSRVRDPLDLLENGVPLVSPGPSGSSITGRESGTIAADGPESGLDNRAGKNGLSNTGESHAGTDRDGASGDSRGSANPSPGSTAANPDSDKPAAASQNGVPAPRVLQSIQDSTNPLLKPDSNTAASGQPASGSPLPSTGSAAGEGQPVPTLSDQRSSKPIRAFRRAWGLPNPNGSIALEKPVTVRLSDDRIVIGGKYRITRSPDRTRQQLIEWTILAIDRVVTEWGRPPRRFYWVPEIKLSADDRGGILLLEPMRSTLLRTGVSIDVLSAGGDP